MLKIQNLSMKYDNKPIFYNLNIIINEFDKIAFYGDSGIGKTTLFNLIHLDLSPNKGNILYLDQNIYNFSFHKKQKYKNKIVSYVSQRQNFFENKSVFENLNIFYKKKDIIDILTKTNLVGLANQKFSTLSGGQKQKIAIIRAMLANTKIYLFDEITSALDKQSEQEILKFIFTFLKNKTLLFITHNLESIENMVNKIYKLEHYNLTCLKEIETPKTPYNNQTTKKMYNIKKIELLNTFKKPFSFFTLLIVMFLGIISLNSFLTFDSSKNKTIYNTLNHYLDYNIFNITNNLYSKIELLNSKSYPSLDIISKDLIISFNNLECFMYELKPLFNTTTSIIVTNQFLLENNLSNKTTNIIEFEYNNNSYFTFKTEDILIYDEKNFFNKPCIYYNYQYFYDIFVNNKNTNYILLKTNNKKIIYTNNFLDFVENKTNKKLLRKFINQDDNSFIFYNDAYIDYYINIEIHTAIFNLIKPFCLFTVICLICCFVFITIYELNKNIKKIAIYLHFGASYFECFIAFFIKILLVYLIIFIYNANYLFELSIFSLIYIIIVLISIQKFIKKDLVLFLKDDVYA